MLDGKRHGTGEFVSSGGQIYEGEWKSSLRHGEGRLVYNLEKNVYYAVSMNKSIIIFYVFSIINHYRALL